MWWNGTDITEIPTLIYHDELITSQDNAITNINGPGSLACRFIAWLDINWFGVTDAAGDITTGNDGNFKQRKERGPPSLSQLTQSVPVSTPRWDDNTNGLWYCSISGMTPLYVGIYGRING